MHRSPADRKAEAARMQQRTEYAQERTQQRTGQGQYSNDRIAKRNGGIPPQFVNDIGGCSDNYR